MQLLAKTYRLHCAWLSHMPLSKGSVNKLHVCLPWIMLFASKGCAAYSDSELYTLNAESAMHNM